jgi:ABC-type glutathione transport system ATPase component
MVRVSGLKLSFGSQVLFDGVSFTIGKGERIGLVGRNGSGKTSLFNILAGKLRCDEGSISFPREYRVGYAEQSLSFTGDTALAEVCGGGTFDPAVGEGHDNAFGAEPGDAEPDGAIPGDAVAFIAQSRLFPSTSNMWAGAGALRRSSRGWGFPKMTW